MKKNIVKTYNFLKEKYNDINEIPNTRLITISKIIKKNQQDIYSYNYLLFASIVIFSITLFPVGYNYVEKIINVIITYVNNQTFEPFVKYIKGMSGFMFFLKVLILLLILIIPFVYNFLLVKNIVKEKWINIYTDNFAYIMSVIGFFVIGFLIIIFNIYFDLKIRMAIMDYFKFILVLFFSILLYFIILTLIIRNIPYIKKLSIVSQIEFSTNLRLETSLKILFLLEKIDNYNFFDNPQYLKNLELELYEISNTIQNISYDYDANKTEIDKEFLINISNAFYSDLINLLYLGNVNSTVLKKKLIEYFNVFINGNISDLPIKQIGNKNKTNRKITFALLITYLIIPFIVLLVIKYIYKIDIDELIQSLFKMLYIIWAFIGIFSNPLMKDKENKELIKDILSIFGK